jgi:transposase|tara:strand:- start:9704 stop:10024 length:321 start_codon:yes stop_codon:yes gene_type:complete
MTIKPRKIRLNYTPKQKYEYARLMVEEHYSNQQIMDISGSGTTVVARWKKQYLNEQRGKFTEDKVPLDLDKRLIEELKKELAESRKDVRLLKKPTALFIRDNLNLK